MEQKNIVMFFGKKRQEPDPFWDFGQKREVYYDFFRLGTSRGYHMFLANGKQSHKDGNIFQETLFFDGKSFVKYAQDIIADVIIDRSATMNFPLRNMSNVLNPLAFKKLCASKNAMQELLVEYMPTARIVENSIALEQIYQGNKDDEQMYVLKPNYGFGGKGIVFGTLAQLRDAVLDSSMSYTLQQFVETKNGIAGITICRHDLRIVIIGDDTVWVTVREPQGDDLLANVAQGGTIRDITTTKLPQYINDFSQKIQNVIRNKYGNKLIYSIDIGIENEKPYLFELNDQIGFPTKNMPAADKFIDKLLNQLEVL